MCLAIPGKLLSREEETGIVDLGGISQSISLIFTPEVKIGDWVIIHTGFALNIITESDARKTIELLQEVYGKE
ncbi:MAG: HypC/HybG/HupF family hydrogenase formation chaperone [Candidatus Cloacimonetes bacterium]|nr:HypC/HybG/HupF family hydrogenase formation chaperone [Candidatus Cloacimonadota bacterium]